MPEPKDPFIERVPEGDRTHEPDQILYTPGQKKAFDTLLAAHEHAATVAVYPGTKEEAMAKAEALRQAGPQSVVDWDAYYAALANRMSREGSAEARSPLAGTEGLDEQRARLDALTVYHSALDKATKGESQE
ncbi:MAG: hypothetical protein AAB473_05280 [Patescibacteria group bacterium]